MLEIKINTENKELASVCELYWEVDQNLDFVHKITQLAGLIDIDKSRLSSVIREVCYAYNSDWACIECNRPFRFTSRSEFLANRYSFSKGVFRSSSFLCHECDQRKRREAYEEQERKVKEARLRWQIAERETHKKIYDYYDLSRRTPIDVQSLSLTDAIYLLSMLRGGAYEDLSKIRPVEMFDQALSADTDFSTEIINHLSQRNLIYIHPHSEASAFMKDDISRYNIFRVSYAPPISQDKPNDPQALVVELLDLVNSQWPEEWCYEALELWKKVALSECKQYLLFVLKEHQFEFNPGEKTSQYLEFALEHFSTGQAFNTIWRSVKDAAASYQRGNISKRQAANMAIASIQRISERAIAEEWDLKPFGRNYACPQAVTSEIFYNSAVKLGNEGFQLVPDIDIIYQKKLKYPGY